MSIQYNDRLVWPGGRTRAITLSFDDGVEQDMLLLQILNRYGAKCTFNLNPGLFGKAGTVTAGGKEVPHNKLTREKVLSTYRDHEIAGHGMYHAYLDGMDSARVSREVLSCREELERLLQRPVTGFCYAFGSCNPALRRTLAECGISYSRTVRPSYGFGLPKDFLEWDPTCHYRDDRLFELADAFMEDVPGQWVPHMKLFFVWGHSYEFERNDDWERMEQFLTKMTDAGNIWFATNGQIAEYVQAFQRLVFTLDGTRVFNPSAIPVCIGGHFTTAYTEVGPGQTAELIPARDI